MPNRPKKGTGFDAGPTVSQVFDSAANRVAKNTQSPLAGGKTNDEVRGSTSAFRGGMAPVARREMQTGPAVTDSMSFGQAFRTARQGGAKDFTWKGRKYTTQTASEAPKSAPRQTAPAQSQRPRQGSGYRVQVNQPSATPVSPARPTGVAPNPFAAPMRSAANGPSFGPSIDQSRTIPMRNEMDGFAKVRADRLAENRRQNNPRTSTRGSQPASPTFQERMRLRGSDTQSTQPDFPVRNNGLLPQNGGGVRMSDPADRERRRREAREK